MPRVFPLEGLTYSNAAGPLERVTAPPYDVISEARRRAYLLESPYNVVHLDLAEGSDDPADPSNRYDRAAELLREWERTGILRRAASPSYYGYEMSFAHDGIDRRIRGLLLALELEPWGMGVVPHERTLAGPLEDRLRLLRATRTHISAVYGTIAGPCEPLASLLGTVPSGEVVREAVDEQGVRHRMWPIAARPEIACWFAGTPVLIADGHHRYTTALRYRDEVDARLGPGPWDRVLALVVDAAAEALPVLPFHRIQRSGPQASGGEAVADLSGALSALSDEPPVIASVTRADHGLRFAIHRLEGASPAVRALHDGPLSAEERSGELSFTPDAEEAVAAVASGDAATAWLLPPTTPDRIRDVIARGERLPQKSTYFWPKPRTGMLMMPVDR